MMRKKNNIYSWLLVGILCFCTYCTENEKTDIVPPTLSNIYVENIPGGSIIYYDEIIDNQIILVTAKYPLDNGAEQILRFDIENHSSSLKLENLSPTKRMVELYTVSKFGNYSPVKEIEIEPLYSLERVYMNDIIEDINITPIPGGIELHFNNNTEERTLMTNLSFLDQDGTWIKLPEVHSITQKQGVITLDDIPYSDFSLFLSDDKNEISDTKFYKIVPIIEKALDNSLWANYLLANDTPGRSSYPIEGLWDDNVRSRFESRADPFPQSFTIDLGENQNLKLSKVKFYFHSTYIDYAYDEFQPKIIELYGSNNPGNEGNWSDWIKLADCVSVKPSGAPLGTVLATDFEYIQQGEVHKIIEPEVYRYIRLNVFETWGGDSPHTIRLNEIQLWGID